MTTEDVYKMMDKYGLDIQVKSDGTLLVKQGVEEFVVVDYDDLLAHFPKEVTLAKQYESWQEMLNDICDNLNLR